MRNIQAKTLIDLFKSILDTVAGFQIESHGMVMLKMAWIAPV
jgi:hypothetical protein